MKTKTIGYIVLRGVGALALNHKNSAFPDIPEGGILLYGYHATLFTDRKAAQAAVQRTQRYCKKNNHEWGSMAIVLVKEQGAP